jgi:uncharacterized protein YbjT (DUF2867 family)
MDPFLVTGGTGRLGRHVVRRLREAGRDVRALTRRARPDQGGVRWVAGDLLSGAGVAEAVDGVATIIHCAGTGKRDEAATRNLMSAVARAGRPHLVYISVVGADRVPVDGAIDRTVFGYFDMKRKAEQIVESSGLPWTTLRATQFYDLVLLVVQKLAKLPIIPVPSDFVIQPIEADDVAARLVELAMGEPAGLVPDVAGPRTYGLPDLVRGYLEAAHRRGIVLPIRLPGKAARAVRGGALLAPDHAVGRTTWEQFLADHLPDRPDARSATGLVTPPRPRSRA